MKKERTLEIGKATIKIEMNYDYKTIDLDGHVSQTKEVVKLVNVELWADGKLVEETTDGFIYLADDKARFGNIYITESTGIEILNAIEEMHEELSSTFKVDTPAQEIQTMQETAKAMEIETAKRIMKEVESRKTEILSAEEERQWRENYNSANNEGGEGYVPRRATLEDVARAKQILNTSDVLEMREWEREEYKVVEIEHDYDLHAFEIIEDNGVKHTIYPDSLESMESIITALDAGECVDGWEDGMGNTINIGYATNELGE